MGTRLALLVAIVLGIVAALAVRLWVQQEKEKIEAETEPVMVLVAKDKLKKGDPLRKSHMTFDLVPRSKVVAGMIPASDHRLYEGRILLRDVGRGEPIFRSFLRNDPKRGTELVHYQVVKEGKRAVTLRVDQEQSNAYMIRPGDYVDIFGTFDIREAGTSGRTAAGTTTATQSARAGTITVCLMEAVKVLAVDHRTIDVAARNRSQTRYRTLTLEVDPEVAGRLIDAKYHGRIHFALRNRAGDLAPKLERIETFRWQDMLEKPQN